MVNEARELTMEMVKETGKQFTDEELRTIEIFLDGLSSATYETLCNRYLYM